MSAGPPLDALRAADAEARRRSQTSFDRPLVLEAGAGTGKTATLVARIVAWCLGPGWRRAASELAAQQQRSGKGEAAGAERVAARVLDGVVAITFTEAAAAEMASRVAQALAEVERGGLPKGLLPEALAGADGDERPRAAALLVALDHLVVATIHAFCRRLLADAPLEAGLHPSFAVDADGRVLEEVAKETVEAAFRAALGRPEEGPLVALAVRGFGPAELAAALVDLAAMPACRRRRSPRPRSRPRRSRRWRQEVRAQAAAVAALVAPRVGGLRKNANAIADRERLRGARSGEPRDARGTGCGGGGCAAGEPRAKRLEEWGRGQPKAARRRRSRTWPPSCGTRPAASPRSRATSPASTPSCSRPRGRRSARSTRSSTARCARAAPRRSPRCCATRASCWRGGRRCGPGCGRG